MAIRNARIRIPLIPNQVQDVPVDDLTHGDQPYRTISPDAFDDLKRSIQGDKDFFKRRPCLVNRVGDELIVYAGNQKLDAAISLGWATVPCLVTEISVEDMTKRMLKDNTHAGVFDMDFIELSYDKDFLAEKVGFTVGLDAEAFEKPENIVSQEPIDNKLYSLFNAEKIWVDEKSDKWLQEDIKNYIDTTTTVFGFMSGLRKRFEAATLKA